MASSEDSSISSTTVDEVVPQLVHKLQVFRKALISERTRSASLDDELKRITKRITSLENDLTKRENNYIQLVKDNKTLQKHIVLLTGNIYTYTYIIFFQ